MAWRFRRTLRLFPGVHLNVSKAGVSLSLRRPGATLNLGRRGVYATFGLPGTGLSYRARLGAPRGAGRGLAGSLWPLPLLGALLRRGGILAASPSISGPRKQLARRRRGPGRKSLPFRVP